ncbi:MAG: phage holin family protein [Limisphaerales bacterium]
MLRWIITTLAVLVAANIVPGISYDSASGLLAATLLLGILNAFVRPVMLWFSLPLLIFTLGLFTLVINALLLYWVGQLKSFHVETFGAAFWGALIISVVSIILNSLTGTGNARVRVKREKNLPPPDRGKGNGPVIDV